VAACPELDSGLAPFINSISIEQNKKVPAGMADTLQ